MQLLRKISRATVFGDDTSVTELVLSNKNIVHPLYRVGGSCNGSRKGESDYGDWECLIGNFQALNMTTGEVFRSGQCFLPQFAVDTITGQFSDDVTAVKFAYDVGVKFDSETPTKFTYVVASVIQPAQDDPLNSLFASLPAPTEAPKAIADKGGKSK